jgi:hypothetical protein
MKKLTCKQTHTCHTGTGTAKSTCGLPVQNNNNNNNNHHTPPPLNRCSAVLAWLDWPPLASSFIYGITQKYLFIITTITPKAACGHGNLFVGAN